MAVRCDRELFAWQKRLDLVESVDRVTGEFPKREACGLPSRPRRAAVSVPSNIDEGQGRESTQEFLDVLPAAHGSLRQVEAQAEIAGRPGSIDPDRSQSIFPSSSAVGRLVHGLRNP